MEDPNGNKVVLPPVIFPKLKSTSKCPVPVCNSCLLARSKKRSTGTKKQTIVPEKGVILSCDKYNPRYFVSVDHFVANTSVWLSTVYVQEPSSYLFHGGTLYNDSATGIIWVENQVSLGASETVLMKERYEKCLWEQVCAEISHIHSDNVIFLSDPFRLDCDNKHQEQFFSGFVAQHQNTKSERAIKTIIYMARNFMVHSSLHWKYHGANEISPWSFSIKHAVWLHNFLPNYHSGITPL